MILRGIVVDGPRAFEIGLVHEVVDDPLARALEIAAEFETRGAEGVDEMITVQNIPVWSLCEHHMLPFFGAATISYIPDREIVGLSKLARVVDAFARRLQVQERLTNQIADLVNDTLKPLGVGVHLRCRHLCMEARGVRTHDSNTVTTALRGVIGEEIAARAEFLNLVNR